LKIEYGYLQTFLIWPEVAKSADILVSFCENGPKRHFSILFEDGQFFDEWMSIFKNWPILPQKSH